MSKKYSKQCIATFFTFDTTIIRLEKIRYNTIEAVDDFEELLEKYSLKCKDCDFEARDFNGLKMHMKAKHNK